MTASLTDDPSRLRLGLLVFVVGLATGVVTQVAQSVLPTGWSQAANAISPWLVIAFLIGSAMPGRRSAAFAGAATLVLALVGYYATTTIRYGIGGGTGSLVFWGLGALVGGPVFGIAGQAWRRGSHRLRAIAIGLLAAAAIGEGGYHALVLEEPHIGAGFAIAGALVPLVFGRTRDDRLRAYVATVPALVLAAVGWVASLWLHGITAGL